MKDFVTFEIAKKLKEKGFREKCFATYSPYSRTLKFNEINTDERPASYKLNIEEFRECYNYYKENNIDAPTISHVLRWLREEKKIHIGFGYSPRKKWRYVVMYMDDRFYNKPTLAVDGFIKIEQAALAGIEYVLDNLP